MFRFVSAFYTWYLDDVKVTGGGSSTPDFVPGYSNRTVSGTSQSVTGLTASSTYTFRARTVSTNGTSSNSVVANVTTESAASGTPPTVDAISAQAATVGADFEYTVTATEADGDTVTFACTSTVDEATWLLDEDTGEFLFIPTSAELGANSFSFTAADPDGTSDPVVMSVVVSAAATTSTVSFGATKVVGEEGGSTVTLPVTLSAAADATVQVAVAGTALPGGTDFSLSTTVVFSASGSATSNLVLTVVDDDLSEGPESVRLNLIPVSGATLGTSTQAIFFIRDNDAFSILTANLSSGTNEVNDTTTWEDPGGRILEALQSDIVLMQEWVLKSGTTPRDFVDEYFGTNFYYSIESETGLYSMPNGVISRWPITASGEWSDTEVGNRDFVWATINLPGSRDLHVVSVHLKATGSVPADDLAIRTDEAHALTNYIASAGWPSEDYLVVGGDFNLSSRTETTMQVLTNVVTDAHQPADQAGDRDTNSGRYRPYDLVLPNANLDARHTSFSCYGYTFANGIVFDTRLTWSDGLPPPSLATDSDNQLSENTNMQHMAVLKLFEFESQLDPPQAFGATASSPVQIDLSFTTNSEGQDVVVVWNSDGNFSTPTGSVPSVGASFAGGTVVYTGSTSPQSHTGLSAYSTYYYSCWSVSGSLYSTGLTANATTDGLDAPASIWASVTNSTDFTAAWSAATGATSYRLDVSTNADFSAGSGGSASDLFISEYIEGSGYEKYIEIFNGTGVDVDLADYALVLFANGSASPTTSNNLAGLLASGDVMVYRHSSATNLLGVTLGAVNFNGDDAMALWRISSSSWVDIFGRIGEDPGTAWTDGSFSTKDKTLVRNESVTGGVTVNPASGFPSLGTEWDQYSLGNEDHLDVHTFAGGGSSAQDYIPGYSNRTVAGTSQSVTGLTAEATYYFRVRAASSGGTSVNSSTASVMTVASGPADQTIDFPAIFAQLTTNVVTLAATASSGLPVSFAVGSGLASISGGTTLTFSGAGGVSIVASQAGNASWNPAPSVTNTFSVTKAAASVTLSSLAQTYDGTAKSATATTDPAGLTVGLTYNGNAWAPTNAGSYAVTGTVNDAMYQGSGADTLVISKAAATVTLSDLLHIHDGSPKSATAATAPSGLTVDLTYDGSATAPSAIGIYAVTGTVNEANYEGFASDTLSIVSITNVFEDWVTDQGEDPADPNFFEDADFDGDGATTWDEFLADTDPNLAGSVLVLTGSYTIAMGGGTGDILLQFPASTGRYYQLEYCTGLTNHLVGTNNLGWGVTGMTVTNSSTGTWYGVIRAFLNAP